MAERDPNLASGYTSPPGTSYQGSSSGTGYGNSMGDSTMDQTREKAAEVVDQAREKTGQLVNQVTEQAKPRLEGQKEQAVSSLSSAAKALRQSGGQLREQQEGTVAQFAETAAEQVDRAAEFLRSRDVNELVQEVEQFARQKPYLFLGATAALGLMGGRFLKSSGSKAPQPSFSNGRQSTSPRAYGTTGPGKKAFPAATPPTMYTSPPPPAPYTPPAPPAPASPPARLAENPTWTPTQAGGTPGASDAEID